MPATYRTDDQRFDVIRPLIECAESKIAVYAQARGFPILPCNLCGSQSGLQRDQMTTLISNLEKTIPNVREVMLASVKNVRTTHLLDPNLVGFVGSQGTNETVEAIHPDLLQINEPSLVNQPSSASPVSDPQ